MLSIPEELFLLAVEENRGLSVFSSRLNVGLAGAVFMELSVLKKIQTNGSDEIVVTDSKPVGQDILDNALESLIDADAPVGAAQWISRQAKLPQHALWAERLLEKKILKKSSRRLFGLIPVQRYFVRDRDMKSALCDRLEASLSNARAADERSILLWNLLNAFGMSKNVFRYFHRRSPMETTADSPQRMRAAAPLP